MWDSWIKKKEKKKRKTKLTEKLFACENFKRKNLETQFYIEENEENLWWKKNGRNHQWIGKLICSNRSGGKFRFNCLVKEDGTDDLIV